MKTITLNETVFAALLNGVRHTVSSDNARPVMQYIKVENAQLILPIRIL